MNFGRTLDARWGITLLRIIVGIVFAMHGWQKLTAMGLAGTAGFFGQLGIPLPSVAAAIVIAVELLGGIALILGIRTRWVAIPLAIDMLVAMATVHIPNGFFLPQGYEFVLTLFGAAVALFFNGSGALALDNLLDRERTTARAGAPAYE